MYGQTEKKTELFLIRHGETPSNEQKRYIGRTDEPLSSYGISALEQRKREGRYPDADYIAVSPMLRCVQSAEMIYGRKPDVCVEDFREIDFGSFEGKNYMELSGNPDYQKWIDSGGELPFPDGESREQFTARCVEAFRYFASFLKTEENPPETAALVVHGGTIMAVLSSFSDGDYFSFQCRNGEGYRCELCLGEEISIQNIRKL